MKQIHLTNGGATVVDDEDYNRLNQYRWRQHKGYIESGRVPNVFYIHREVLGTTEFVDHINGNKFDNQKHNLRIVPRCFNRQNSKLNKNSKSGYRGVSWVERTSKWKVKLTFDKVEQHLGFFDDVVVAAKTYDEAAKRYYGEHAKLNFPTVEAIL